jgi:stearoyl-CoA desaturase (delta-9 desaturase)
MKIKTLNNASLNWTNIIFFSSLPLIAGIGTVLLCIYKAVPWQTWVLAAIFMVLTGLAITAGYHRLFAHKTYQAVLPLCLVLLLVGAAAFEGSALEWCTDHRNHHRYTDTEKDPYNIKKGFWHAHMSWLFYLDAQKYDFTNVQDLMADKLIVFQNKYYLTTAILMGFILPTAIASLWGDPLGGLIIASALRMTVNHHLTFTINSVCHYFGKMTYSNRISARDNWLTSLFTYGEGFHNFHHQFPSDYRNGIRLYHYDPAKWIIRLFSCIGLAHNLKRVSQERIIHYRSAYL